MAGSLPIFLERIQECQSCGREVLRKPLEYQEDPYCSSCFRQRVEEGAKIIGPIEWRARGEYFEPISLDPRKLI